MATSTDTRYQAGAPIGTPPVHLNAIDWIALVLMIIGGINWGLVGALRLDLVATIFGEMTLISRIVYVLVGLAAVYGIALAARMARRG